MGTATIGTRTARDESGLVQRRIDRIGGTARRNKQGDAAAPYSIPDCARVESGHGEMGSLPPLPDARSSHDVVVSGPLIAAAFSGRDWRDSQLT